MKTKREISVVKGRRRVVPPLAPFRCENVKETAARFNLPMAKIAELRRLALQDPETDPWIGDFTFPEEFHRWLWGKRRDLEKIQRQREAGKP